MWELTHESTHIRVRGPHFVRACAVETHMEILQEPFCEEIYRKNAGIRFRGARFARACAVETHLDISQSLFGNFFQEIMPHTIPPTSIEYRAFYSYRKSPSVWPHCLRKKDINSSIINDSNTVSLLTIILRNLWRPHCDLTWMNVRATVTISKRSFFSVAQNSLSRWLPNLCKVLSPRWSGCNSNNYSDLWWYRYVELVCMHFHTGL